LIPELVELQSTLSEAPNLANQASLNISKELQNLVAQLSDIQSIPQAKLPEDLHASLRPYQTQGVNWLCFLRDQKMGAMLADDMGLGKTLQTLCAIRGKTLVISPTSVLFAWAKQIDLFRPNLKYSIYYGSQRKFDLNLQDDLQGTPQVLLTTYAILRLDLAILNRHKWDTIVIDEAQIIKNSASQVTQAVHALQGDFKIALSGTPLENRLEDLWSQFQFINPGLLGQLESFQERYVEPISRGGDSQAAVHATQRLRARVRPFLLRRLKQEVATDLPPRTDKVLHCELSAQERELYQALLASTRSEILEKLEAGGSIFSALELLLRLRQACCHGSLIPGQSFQRSSKIELLVSTLLESIACGHRALVFSQWTSYLDLIEPHLSAAHISYSRLDGSTPNRDEVVNDFQKPSGPAVLLLSLKAGGVGLTLTAADHIFLMDPWWNPAVEDQAADRAHRIGQTQSVLIHRLVARETLEEGILELQLQKRKMAASVLDESIPKQSPLQSAGHAMQSISREELIGLLAL
jgi:SNF2 family DNA or RNA helicase